MPGGCISLSNEPAGRPPALGHARRHYGLFGLYLFVSSAGCGNALYAAKAGSAASKLKEAQALGAERQAPYEYFCAREHLEKAQREAAEADYGDAIDLASESEQYADRAISLTRDARRGAGRP